MLLSFDLARIDYTDPGYQHDLWMKTLKRTKPTEEEEELREDSWYFKNMDVLRDNPEQSGLTIIYIYQCFLNYLGYILYLVCIFDLFFAAVRINMWTRARERRILRHRICSRGRGDQPQGYASLKWESILHGNAGELGDYKELAVLPDKIARYLYEFHADDYGLHDIPMPMCMVFFSHTR
jgi:hypothetical protein